MRELVLESAGALIWDSGSNDFLVELRSALKEELLTSNIHFLAIYSFF